MDAPKQSSTVEERLQAMEYVLGQMLLLAETESVSVRAHLQRLESAISHTLQVPLPTPTEEEDARPLTVDAFCAWMQICLERMRAHQSASARQMVAIGELTMRIGSLGGHLSEDLPPAIGQDALAALAKAKRQPPAS